MIYDKRICQKESDPFFFCSEAEEMSFNFTFYDWRLNFLAKLYICHYFDTVDGNFA